MKKELVVLLLVAGVGIGVLVSQFDLGLHTGALVNDIAGLRVQRLDLARSGFTGRALSQECKLALREVQDLIRLNADERYYDYAGLRDTDLYFLRERELFDSLIRLGAAGNLSHPVYLPLTAKSPCPENVALQSQEKLMKLIDFDSQLAYKTVFNSWCPDRPALQLLYETALIRYLDGNYTAYLDYIEKSTERARQC